MTVAQLEHGMRPSCACGEPLLPEDPDLWGLVPADELERSVIYQEYAVRVTGAVRGQYSHVQRGRSVRAAETVALEGTRSRPGMLADLAEERRHRQLAGLRQFKAVTDAVADMPF